MINNGCYVSIPKSIVTDIPALQSNLSSQSRTGRTFEISEKEGRLIIDIQNLRPNYYNFSYEMFYPFFGMAHDQQFMRQTITGSEFFSMRLHYYF